MVNVSDFRIVATVATVGIAEKPKTYNKGWEYANNAYAATR